MTNIDNLKRIWRSKFDKLTRLRYGNNFPPDNKEGRCLLTALMCFGMSEESALESAPWCAAELPLIARRAKRIKWDDIGKRVSLTFEEWKDVGLWRFMPIDKTPDEIEAWRKQRRKDGAALRQQECRERLRHEKERRLKMLDTITNRRHAAILKVLVDHGHPMRVVDIMPMVRKLYEFKDIHTDTGFRSVIHKSINRLERNGVITVTKRAGRTGEKWAFITPKTAMSLCDPPKRLKTHTPQRLKSKNSPVTLAYRTGKRDAKTDIASDGMENVVSLSQAWPYRVVDDGSEPHRPTPYPHLAWSNPTPIKPSAEGSFRCDPIGTDTDMAQAA
jgi:hypothetical protein